MARRDDAGTGNRAQGALFLGPGLVYWLALFLVPVGLILVYSFFRRTSIGGIEYTFTLDNYVRATEPVFVKVFLFSIRTALITTAIALVLGYATAYFIATRPARYRLPLLVLVVLPFWTNLLIRTYAWIALLNNEGLINKGLRGLGIIDSSLPLLNNQFSIVVGLLYAFLPLMVLPLYASIERLGPRLREAGCRPGGLAHIGVPAGHVPDDAPGRARRVHLRVRPEPRELHRARPARRRAEVDGRQPDPAAVLPGEGLAVRRRAGDVGDRDHDGPARGPGADAATRGEDVGPWRVARPRSATGRSARWPILVYVFLYVPIVVLVVLSFNGSGQSTTWGGFSTRWYGEMLEADDLIDGFKNTVIIATATTVIATALGTMLAIGLARHVRSTALDSMLFLPAVVPDLVLAIGLLSFFTLVGMELGRTTVIASHVVFDMIFVAAIVRTRLGFFDASVEEASQDLGANRASTFVRVTLPLIAPGVAAGALVAFTLSFDEFIIAFFTAGPESLTFPIRVYTRIRFGLTPVVNAIATVLLVVSFTLILLALKLNGSATRRAIDRASAA